MQLSIEEGEGQSLIYSILWSVIISPHIETCLHMHALKSGLKIVQILKHLDIESPGYRNMPFDALISGYPKTGVHLYKIIIGLIKFMRVASVT